MYVTAESYLVSCVLERLGFGHNGSRASVLGQMFEQCTKETCELIVWSSCSSIYAVLAMAADGEMAELQTH
jgi:hypothetical protein